MILVFYASVMKTELSFNLIDKQNKPRHLLQKSLAFNKYALNLCKIKRRTINNKKKSCLFSVSNIELPSRCEDFCIKRWGPG